MAFAAVLVVGFLGVSSLIGYKWYKRHQAKKLEKWEFKAELNIKQDLSEEQLAKMLADYNVKLDKEEVLRPVVEDLRMAAFWGMPNDGAAIEMMRQASEFRSGEREGTIIFVVSDKDKEMAGRMASAIGEKFDDYLRRERFDLPVPPPMPPEGF